MMVYELHAIVLGIGPVDLKFTSGKIVQLKNVMHAPSIKIISSVVPVLGKMGLSWCLSPIKLCCLSMELMLEIVMNANVCFTSL
jgi:hypothetical protein